MFQRRRQLKQHRTQLFAELLKHVAESVQHLAAIAQLAEARDFLRRFETEAKCLRSIREPIRECLLAEDAPETVIDFRGRKTLRVIRQHLGQRQSLRVKRALPFLILESRCADPSHGFTFRRDWTIVKYQT